MTFLRTLFGRLRRDDTGLSTVEYVILLALIAIASIGAWSRFGDRVLGAVEDAEAEFDTYMP